MTKQSILPCPFCGKPPETQGSGEGQRGLMIDCITPGCVNPHTSYYDHASAIRVWNTRAAARPAQEPVAWRYRLGLSGDRWSVTDSAEDLPINREEWEVEPLYALTGEQRCAKCGEPTKSEEAWVDGQIWCHPCADAATGEAGK